jgi:hypothetical protein
MSKESKPADLSGEHTRKGILQRALLARLAIHEADAMLPTNCRFLFYELEHEGVVSKERRQPKPGCTTFRTDSQDLADALLRLREIGAIPWEWIEDETREMHIIRSAGSIADYLDESLRLATLDRWDGQPAPLIICESRSLAGVLRATADDYACHITSTNGQTKGFLVTDVVPWMETGQQVLYFGDLDLSGGHIEDKTRSILSEHSGAAGDLLWQRVAITEGQLADVNAERARVGLGDATIMKTDRRHRDSATGRKGVAFPAVETEVLGQARIVVALQTRLDELMPEPLEDVRVREEAQRAEVARLLRRMR